MGKSKIEWTESSWNPIRAKSTYGGIGHHCEHASEGCRNCYAETLNSRFGTGLLFTRQNRDNVTIFLDEKMLKVPFGWKVAKKVFVCSMTDLFADFVPDDMIDRMFAVMAATPQHTYQILTKRPERMEKYLRAKDRVDHWVPHFRDMRTKRSKTPESLLQRRLPNVWLGTSIEDRKMMHARVPVLLRTPAVVRFLSVEPLLEEISLAWFLGSGIGWVIIGGESGAGARPLRLSWVRVLLAECEKAGVPVFVKQLGAKPFSPEDRISHRNCGALGRQLPQGVFCRHLNSAKGGDPNEWPEDLRIRQWPQVEAVA